MQDLYTAFLGIQYRLDNFKGLGMKGATGTQDSLMKLFDGDKKKVQKLDELVAQKLGFSSTFQLTGQTYPRLFDYQLLSDLACVSIAAGRAGLDLRLMQHRKEVEEPFSKDQTGSSAMAYKRNPIRTERMCSLARHVITLSQEPAITAVGQMHERTLDDSAGRRIYMPDAFYGTDAVLELYMFLMDGLVVYPKMIERHLGEELPFMATEEILMESVKRGGDRQTIHERIRQHAMEAGNRVKTDDGVNDLLDRIADDGEIPLDREEVYSIAGDYSRFTGRSASQVESFVKDYVEPLRREHPDALKINPVVEI